MKIKKVVYTKFEEHFIKYETESNDDETPYWFSFEVKEITGYGPDPSREFTIPLFGFNFLEDYAEAEIFLHGNIKWDGCSNWDFHSENIMVHFCGRKDATSLGRLMNHLYDIAENTLCPSDLEMFNGT